MDNPTAQLLRVQIDEVKLPFFVRPHTVTHNEKLVSFNNGWAYGSRLIYEGDSRKLYFELESPRILINGAYQPTILTRLEDGVIVRVRNCSPVTIFWDWDGVSKPRKVKAYPETFKHPNPLLPLGKQRVFALSAMEHTTVELPTRSIYFMFERRFEIQQVRPE